MEQGEGTVWSGAYVTMQNVTFDSNIHLYAGAIQITDTASGDGGNVAVLGSMTITESM
jgi:hypothetical protein